MAFQPPIRSSVPTSIIDEVAKMCAMLGIPIYTARRSSDPSADLPLGNDETIDKIAVATGGMAQRARHGEESWLRSPGHDRRPEEEPNLQ